MLCYCCDWKDDCVINVDYVTEKLKLVEGNKAGVEATLASLRIEILARAAMGIR